jgi:phage shock protein C
MFCTGCGRKMQDADAYCPQCGRSVRPLPPPRRLYRLLGEKKIAGVCAGVARYLEVDVTIVRIVWLLLALLHGIGIIGYIIAWIVMPSDYQLSYQRQYA